MEKLVALRWDGLAWSVIVCGAVAVLAAPVICLTVAMLSALQEDTPAGVVQRQQKEMTAKVAETPTPAVAGAATGKKKSARRTNKAKKRKQH